MAIIKNAYGALITAAVIISFSSVLVKLSNVPSTVSAFYRVLFGGVFLIFMCGVKGELKRRKPRNIILAVACGLLFALDLWAWHLSIQYIGPGLATILGNCQVFVLTIVGYLWLKEKISLAFIVAVPMAFFGLFLIIGLDIENISPQYMTGVGLGFATAGFYSMFLLLLRKIQSDKTDYSQYYYLMVLSVSCAFFLGMKAVISGDSFVIPDRVTWLSLISLGLFIQCMAWMLISNALPKVRASHAGLILVLQPALSFVWDVMFFDRPTGWLGWTGVIIVLTAIYFGMAGKKET